MGIVFTSGTTESINLAASGWAKHNLKAGDIIVTSEMEHHSNFVPWLRLKEEIGIELVILPLGRDYRIDYKSTELDYSRVKLIALSHASNVLGTVNPIADISGFFRQKGANARLAADAAQSVPHMPVNVQDIGADFLAFSSHKMLGPSGVGVLYVKKELLDQMKPVLVGSHMIESVSKDQAVWAEPPAKFEPGTRNIEGVIGLGAAIDYLKTVGMANMVEFENKLTAYFLEKLGGQAGVKLFGPSRTKDRIGVFSFAVGNVHPHDTAEILNRSNIAVRAGHHCAEPLMQTLEVPGTVRASLYLYNDKSDVDKLVESIDEVKRVFRIK